MKLAITVKTCAIRNINLDSFLGRKSLAWVSITANFHSAIYSVFIEMLNRDD
jgi:hypothetical protein